MTAMNRIYYLNSDAKLEALLKQKSEKSFSSVRSYRVKQMRGNCVMDTASGPGM